MKMNWSKTVRVSLGGFVIAGFLCLSLQRAEAAVLANYDFQNSDGVSSDSDTGSTAGVFSFNGLGAIGFDPNPGIAGLTTSIAVNASGMPTSQGTIADYLTFVITPTSGNRLDMAGAAALTFDYGRVSQLAAFNWAVQSSVDGFASNIASGTTPTSGTLNQASITLSSAFDSQDTGVTFRIYLWDNGDNGSAKGFIDNVVLNGTVVPVPEPINVALGVFGLCLAGVGVGRRYLLKRS